MFVCIKHLSFVTNPKSFDRITIIFKIRYISKNTSWIFPQVDLKTTYFFRSTSTRCLVNYLPDFMHLCAEYNNACPSYFFKSQNCCAALFEAYLRPVLVCLTFQPFYCVAVPGLDICRARIARSQRRLTSCCCALICWITIAEEAI